MRSFRKPRFPFVTYGKFGRLSPLNRHLVNPGETLSELRAQLKFQSLPIKYALTGATVDMWAFYIPHRLVDDQFPERLMTNGALPQGTSFGELHFSNVGDLDYYKKSYELVVNTFFRTDDMDPYVASAATAALPVVDLTGEFYGDTDEADADESIPVTDNAVSLQDIDDARAKRRYEERMQNLDGNYVNYLRLQGVRIEETAMIQPEMIASSRTYVQPVKTIDQSTGFTVQSYMKELKLKFRKPRYFQEHGMVIVAMAIRPKILHRSADPIEAFITSAGMLPHKGQLREQRRLDNETKAFGGFTTATQGEQYLDHYYLHGCTMVAQPVGITPMTATHSEDDRSLAVIPENQWDNMCNDATVLSGQHYGVDGVIGFSIKTPYRFVAGTA